MVSYPTERMALFIDSANVYYTMKMLGWHLDHDRLLTHFAKQGLLLRPYFYLAMRDPPSRDDPMHGMAMRLAYNGYSVVTKPLKVITNHATGEFTKKGNMDVEITTDMMRLASQLSHLVLFSGDGDFTYLVKTLQDMGKRVTVVTTQVKKDGEKVAAEELIRQADNFIELETLRATCSMDAKDRTRAALGMSKAPEPEPAST